MKKSTSQRKRNTRLRVLVATKETQGFRKSDFSWTKEGEIVKFSPECDSDKNVDDKCGCRRAVTGLETHKATTTFKVVLMDISKAELIKRVYKSYEVEGWLKSGLTVEDVKDDVAELLSFARYFPVGAVLEKRGNKVKRRS